MEPFYSGNRARYNDWCTEQCNGKLHTAKYLVETGAAIFILYFVFGTSEGSNAD